MRLLQSLILGIPVVVAGSPVLVERAPTAPFGLFAYGEGIGDGAYIGTATHTDDSEAAQVECKMRKNLSYMQSH
ncbi:hypothetical protein PC116_g33381 [Phytophthora cactorum]|nr:hypothetical protein PC116_g33381 [Phytophthora cactorum]